MTDALTTKADGPAIAGDPTPGPWRVCERAENPTWFVGTTIYSQPTGQRVADAFVLSPYHSANAHLIAAAPELYAALERIANAHDCGCRPCRGQCRSQHVLQIALDEIRDQARAALRLARGEQS